MEGSEAGYYHCLSRIVNRDFIFGDEEKEHFVALMRGYEAFCGVQIVTYCVMSNHFHILVKVPRRPEVLPSDEALVSLAKQAGYSYDAGTLKQDLKRFREDGQDGAAEELRERLFCRMWDVSWFMKMLKQRFSQWYNGRHDRKGTLWEERFRSVLVEGAGRALAAMAAYIDLNPFRAGIVDDPAQYRWCGYAEAVAGRKQARKGLSMAVEAALGNAVDPRQVMGEYRKHLFREGEQEKRNEAGAVVRRGIGEERVKEVLAGNGKIDLLEAIRCRVRYFCDGVVLGSRAFVNEFFKVNRSRFGSRRREGARRLHGINAPDLFALRDVRVASGSG